MTGEKAIKMLEYIKRTGNGESEYQNDAQAIAIDMAIKALKQGDVLDKIRTEIIDTLYVDSLIFGELIGYREGKIRTDDVIEEFNRVTKAEILKIIDKYKAEQGVSE